MSLANRLRERVTIEQPVDVPDGSGGQTRSWTNVATVSAEYLSLSMNEQIEAGALQGIESARFMIRYRTDVDTTCRLTWRGKVYNITGATDLVGRRDVKTPRTALELLCVSGVAT